MPEAGLCPRAKLFLVLPPDLRAVVLALPEEERAELRDELDASLTVKVDDELMAILKEREAAFDRGEPGVPADEAFARLLRR